MTEKAVTKTSTPKDILCPCYLLGRRGVIVLIAFLFLISLYLTYIATSTYDIHPGIQHQKPIATQTPLVEHHDWHDDARARYEKQSGKSEESVRYLTVQVRGRIGNVMFLYASMMGIARENNMTPAFPEDHFLHYMFELTALPYRKRMIKSWKKVVEERACVFDSKTESLPKGFDVVELNGYYQSWKYFEKVKSLVRKEFTFRETIKQKAAQFLQGALYSAFGAETPPDVVLVGLHVRLSDMADKYSQWRGYTVANTSYVGKAMEYFEERYDPKKLIFVVCSDEIELCKKKVKPKRGAVVFSRGLTDVEDLALLSMCNHTIITVGTFGWWAAWLSPPGSTTVYYKDFPRPNSSLAAEFSSNDYFYPSWIGMSN